MTAGSGKPFRVVCADPGGVDIKSIGVCLVEGQEWGFTEAQAWDNTELWTLINQRRIIRLAHGPMVLPSHPRPKSPETPPAPAGPSDEVLYLRQRVAELTAQVSALQVENQALKKDRATQLPTEGGLTEVLERLKRIEATTAAVAEAPTRPVAPSVPSLGVRPQASMPAASTAVYVPTFTPQVVEGAAGGVSEQTEQSAEGLSSTAALLRKKRKAADQGGDQ